MYPWFLTTRSENPYGIVYFVGWVKVFRCPPPMCVDRNGTKTETRMMSNSTRIRRIIVAGTREVGQREDARPTLRSDFLNYPFHSLPGVEFMPFVTQSFRLSLFAFICLSPLSVFALMEEEYGNKELSDANYQSWPGIMSVINNKARTYLVWVNGHENFQFKGTTAQLNKTLNNFAWIQGMETREVVLRVGLGVRPSLNSKKKFPVDWELNIMPGVYAHMFTKDQAIKVWRKDPVLTVYISDRIKLSEIVIPAGITVIGPTQLGKRFAEGILTSKNIRERCSACRQLALVSPYDAENLELIGNCLSDENRRVQLQATFLIATFGKKAEKYLPKLKQLAESDDESLKKSSLQAIEKIEKAGDTAASETRYNDVLAQINDFVDQQTKSSVSR
jgi:hypothetical protein